MVLSVLQSKTGQTEGESSSNKIAKRVIIGGFQRFNYRAFVFCIKIKEKQEFATKINN